MAKVQFGDVWTADRELIIEWVKGELTIYARSPHTQYIEFTLTPKEVEQLKEVLKI